MGRTVEYSYQVQRRDAGDVIPRFRYIVGTHGGADRHHCHRFDENGLPLRIENVGP